MVNVADVVWMLIGEFLLMAGLVILLYGYVYFPMRPMRLYRPALALFGVLALVCTPLGVISFLYSVERSYAVVPSRKAFGAHGWSTIAVDAGFIVFGLVGWVQIGLRLYCRVRYGAPDPDDLKPPPPVSEEELQAVLARLRDPALLREGPEAMADYVVNSWLRVRGTPGWEDRQTLRELARKSMDEQLAGQEGDYAFCSRFTERYLRQANYKDPEFV